MKFIDEFRDQALVQDLARRLGALATRSRHRHGGLRHPHHGRGPLRPEIPFAPRGRAHLRPRLPGVRHRPVRPGRLPGPGDEPGVVLVSFGDMLRVPGTHTSLEGLRAQGAAVRVVYSPLDAVELARQTPEKHVVFFGVGFETTMPAIAMAIQAAAQYGWIIFRSAASTRPCPRPCGRSWPAAKSGFPGSSAPATSPPSSGPRPTISSRRIRHPLRGHRL